MHRKDSLCLRQSQVVFQHFSDHFPALLGEVLGQVSFLLITCNIWK